MARRTKLKVAKLCSLVVAAAFLALVAFGCGGGAGGGQGGGDQGGGGGNDTGGEGGGNVRPALVLDIGGLGDQSFNDSAFAGLQRAEKELNVEGDYLESNAPTDYVNNLTQLSDNGSSPIFAVGFLLTDAVNEVAAQYPDVNYAIIDSVAEGPNVASLVFREQEAGYLAGVVAGLMTQEDTEYTSSDENIVGFLGGQEGSPPVVRFQAGYEAGVRSVCEDCEILSQYAGTTPDAFNDPARGREIALQQIQQGADIIFHGAGATGAGLFDAATDEKIFAIGVDSDQAKLVPDAPILTSALKRVDNAVFQTIEQANNGNFPGGQTVEFGVKNGGLDLADFGRFEDQVPQEVKDAVKEAKQGISNGEIEVPTEVQGG